MDDRRANRPGACRRSQPRAKAGANRARGQPSLDRPKRRRADPPPGRPAVDARPVRGRRAADAGRHAIRLLDIGARGRRHGRPQPAAGAPSSSARRPDRLAHRIAGARPRRVPDVGDRAARRARATVEWAHGGPLPSGVVRCEKSRPSMSGATWQASTSRWSAVSSSATSRRRRTSSWLASRPATSALGSATTAMPELSGPSFCGAAPIRLRQRSGCARLPLAVGR
jgi:hypothetical protein